MEMYWFSEQPYSYTTDEDLEKYESGRLHFPNTYFDPVKANALYRNYHDQYAWVDEIGFDGIMTNEHHGAYWCMKTSANIDAAIIAKVTKRVKIALVGNNIAVNDPVRMAEELAMLDCVSGGRIISGFVRGGAVESLHGGVSPPENRERFEEAHDLIIKCWTTPSPFRWEGKYFSRRMINPWVRPLQIPHPPIWFAGSASPESVIWAARNKYPYMNLGTVLAVTMRFKQLYMETALETGYQAGPEHFGYLIKVLVADTDERAQEIGRNFLWTEDHRHRAPVEFNDPPGYQSREAFRIKLERESLTSERVGFRSESIGKKMTYEELQNAYHIVVGNPDTVIKKIRHIKKTLDPGYLLLYGNEGPMPHEAIMRSIELLGTKVIPALKDA